MTTDRFWGNYETLLDEIDRKLDTFATFDEQDHFNMQACLDKVHEYSAKQKNVMLLLNTPAHNPTGFSVTDDEWKTLIAELSAVANNGTNNVVLVVDVAYLDFAGPDGRNFFKLFTNLPKNFMVVVCFSMSKGYTMYGYRLGCMIGVSSDKEAIEEFKLANTYSSRATWSNCNRAGMLTMMEITNDPEKQAAFKAEQEALRLSLVKRAETFTKEAQEVGLKIAPIIPASSSPCRLRTNRKQQISPPSCGRTTSSSCLLVQASASPSARSRRTDRRYGYQI